MKATVISNPHYFGRTWQLRIKTKKDERTFFLGQDVKVCSRILGMSPRQVINEIGSDNIGNGTKGADRLGKFIADRIGVNGRNMKKLEAWALACE